METSRATRQTAGDLALARVEPALDADERGPASARRAIETLSSQTLGAAAYAPGRILAGRYRVERLLGEGAMGVVVAARHLELDELVAIKFIHPDVPRDADVIARFAREAKASARIKSEHVVKLLDVGVTLPIGPYIVLEYLEGHDLSAALEQDGPLPVPRAVECVMQACEALAAAHALGITHRDIKPENLFSTFHGDLERIKLLDFGISKAVLSGRVFGDELVEVHDKRVLGTPLYVSPEQIRDADAVDHRSDIWSLGAVLYELVTGVAAFTAADVEGVYARVRDEQPAPMAAHLQSVPVALQWIIDRCLQKDPAKRFQDVIELALALAPLAPPRARLYAELWTSALQRPSIGPDEYDIALPVESLEAPRALEPRGAVVGAVEQLAPSASNARRRQLTLAVAVIITLSTLAASALLLLRADGAAPPIVSASTAVDTVPASAPAVAAVTATHLALKQAPSLARDPARVPSAAESRRRATKSSAPPAARKRRADKRRATAKPGSLVRADEAKLPTPAPIKANPVPSTAKARDLFGNERNARRGGRAKRTNKGE